MTHIWVASLYEGVELHRETQSTLVRRSDTLRQLTNLSLHALVTGVQAMRALNRSCPE